MKKTNKKVISILVVLVMMFLVASSSFASNERHAEIAESVMRAQYVAEFVNYIEGSDVTTIAAANLRDVFNDQVIAVCYTLSTGGYAIIDIQKNNIYEYSLENSSPYTGFNEPYYYEGPFNYYVQESFAML